jgi:UDP-N-acetylglucosamine 1-carboxyvinyltransferase
MASYIINGGKKLSGEITVNSSKNGAVAILIASLLNKKKTVIKNLPKIEEVFRIIEVLESIGVEVGWSGHKVEIIPPKKFNLARLNRQAAERTRSIVLFAGVLAHYFPKFSLPVSGGCKLGKRSIMPHIYALEEFGIKVKILKDSYKIQAGKLHPASNLVLYESGDTVTENAILAAALIPGKTIIKFASANYQVQDLCFFLSELGVKILGIGTSTLVVEGLGSIKKEISYSISEDPIEAMLFLTIAITTNSSIAIKRCPIDFLELELLKLEKMGFKYKILKRYKAKNRKTNLCDIKTYPSKLTASAEKIAAKPFPGINIDNLPFFVPIAVCAKGETLIHDWAYENRAVYFAELNALGADITLSDPHRVFVKGAARLSSSKIVCPPALRPSTIILAAMLGARGKSILSNIYSIERGHEDLCGRLEALGARIRKLD